MSFGSQIFADFCLNSIRSDLVIHEWLRLETFWIGAPWSLHTILMRLPGFTLWKSTKRSFKATCREFSNKRIATGEGLFGPDAWKTKRKVKTTMWCEVVITSFFEAALVRRSSEARQNTERAGSFSFLCSFFEQRVFCELQTEKP